MQQIDSLRSLPSSRIEPDPLLLTRSEVDELYDLLEIIVQCLDELRIPYILIGGTLLGAIRSQSILFNDDDIDIAIFDGKPGGDSLEAEGHYARLKKELPSLLEKAATLRNTAQQLKEQSVYMKPSPNIKYMYQIRPWVACDRIRSSYRPRVWIDLFILRKYESLQDMKNLLSVKANGEDQSLEYVNNILEAISTSSSIPLDSMFPLYHYDNRKAIELWPREYFMPEELFPLESSLAFGPLQGISGPRLPLRALFRFFGTDCFTHFYRADSHVRGKKQKKDSYIPWELCPKVELSDFMYLPVQHSNIGRRVDSKHNKETLESYLRKQLQLEGITGAAADITLSQLSSRSLTETSRDHSISNVNEESSLEQGPTMDTELQQKSNWFGVSVRIHTNASSEVPVFDQALRDVMEPHLNKARERRRDCLQKLCLNKGLQNKIDTDKLSIASNIGVPYPSLRAERPFLFDVETYPLHQILAETFGVADLSLMHDHRIKNKFDLMSPLLDRTLRHSFHQCYENFVTSFCIPLLHSIAVTQRLFTHSNKLLSSASQSIRYRYQAFPCIRVVHPGEFSIGPHCDTLYGLSLGNINFHIPLTPVYGTNPLFTESHPGKEDWHPFMTKSVGLGYIFDGSRCMRFTLENTTQHTRVSLDFRISISRANPSSSRRPSRVHSSWKFGDLTSPGDQNFHDIDDELCNETMLADRFAATPGYYDEAFIDVSGVANQSFITPNSLVYKKNRNQGLLDPDYRVGFPFTGS